MDGKILTPMMKQYIAVKKEYPDGILLFRAGDFYEMFYDDAKTASLILNITLTKRGKGETEAPLAGIPYHSIDPYINKLIKAGKKVVVCEQVENPKLAKGIVKRAVTRVITPSTLFSESYENNFLCSISQIKDAFGFSLVDITTGEFKIGFFTTVNDIFNELSLIKPKELILTKNILKYQTIIDNIKKIIPHTIINYTDNLDSNLSEEELKNHFNLKTLDSFGINNNETYISAYNALKYLKETQFSELKYINTIKQLDSNKYLKLDKKTVRNLELITNLQDNTHKDSLFNLINKTKTAMGFRKLYFDILHPLLDKSEATRIQDSVSEFIEDYTLLENITNDLAYISDLDRVISKVGFGNASPRDLVSLRQSLEVIPKIKSTLLDTNSINLKLIRDNLIDLEELRKVLDESIVEDPPFSVRDGKFINPNYSKELSDLINTHKYINSWVVEFEARLRNETNIKSLKLKYNKVYGYYIEVPKAQLKTVPDYFERKQTLVNAERFTTKELIEKEGIYLNSEDKRIELEYIIFLDICKFVIKFQEQIQSIAKQLGALDTCASHAKIAISNNYSKPKLTTSDKVYFKDLRHPIIETLVDFIPNDCDLTNSNRTMIITGPNMAGKSSYMRSVCLAIILGQMGSFIPATDSEIGIVDGVFTRVGASDDILHGQSTFLVEMSEVAYILNHATKNSFVILDEIGRGTSTYDGLSLAWAIVDQLNNETKCKTLVATHYHLLNRMQEKYDGLNNYHVTAEEEGSNLHFYHKLMIGGINKSYGIQVAKMAGISDTVIQNALVIQKALEDDEFLKLNSSKDLNTKNESPSPGDPRKIKPQKEITDYKE